MGGDNGFSLFFLQLPEWKGRSKLRKSIRRLTLRCAATLALSHSNETNWNLAKHKLLRTIHGACHYLAWESAVHVPSAKVLAESGGEREVEGELSAAK